MLYVLKILNFLKRAMGNLIVGDKGIRQSAGRLNPANVDGKPVLQSEGVSAVTYWVPILAVAERVSSRIITFSTTGYSARNDFPPGTMVQIRQIRSTNEYKYFIVQAVIDDDIYLWPEAGNSDTYLIEDLSIDEVAVSASPSPVRNNGQPFPMLIQPYTIVLGTSPDVDEVGLSTNSGSISTAANYGTVAISARGTLVTIDIKALFTLTGADSTRIVLTMPSPIPTYVFGNSSNNIRWPMPQLPDTTEWSDGHFYLETDLSTYWRFVIYPMNASRSWLIAGPNTTRRAQVLYTSAMRFSV